MPIRAVEISKKFLIFLFSPPYLDFPPPKPLPSTPQSFFPPFKTFFGTWKKIFFGKFSHLALFGTFWPNLPKHGLLGLKPERLTRAFISRDKIWRFLAGTPFSYFFGTFCKFLAISAKNSFFSSFLPLSRQTNDKFGNNLKIFKASPHYLGKKLVEFDLDLLEITQNWQKWRDFTSFSFLPFLLS